MKPIISLSLVMLLAHLLACDPADKTASDSEAAVELQIVAELDKGPGNITVTPSGDIIVSLHQFYGEDMRVAEIESDNELIAFAGDSKVNSVLGLQADEDGVVWLLDNAMRGGDQRQLVGWDAATASDISIDLSTVTTDQTFLNDLAVDPETETVYIADPASGEDAAIVVVDLSSGESRRLLQGHISVVPEDMDLVIDGTPVEIRIDEDKVIRPRVGINPIALDKDGEWLYYGPMHGLSMYRVRTADLRDASLSAEQLAARVERWADKPICDGISIDDEGNLYLGDLANNAIGVIGPDRQYRTLIADPRLSWVDAFSFGPDGYLYTVINQLHRSAVLNAGTPATVPPYLIMRFEPLAGGTVGR